MLIPSTMWKSTDSTGGGIIRIAGRIQHEFIGNGCINRDGDFHKMLDTFLRYLRLGNGFSDKAI